MADASLRILVPCDATAAVGLRPIAGPRAVQRIVAVLESEPETIKESWSVRQRRNVGRLKGGDVLELSAVIRDLVLRAADGKLLSSERQLLERSRPVLASELRYALGVGVEQADAYIDEHVNGRARQRSANRRSQPRTPQPSSARTAALRPSAASPS